MTHLARCTVLHPPTPLVPNSPAYLDFQKCYANADTPSQCTLPKEDYLECLHHTKEVCLKSSIATQLYLIPNRGTKWP